MEGKEARMALLKTVKMFREFAPIFIGVVLLISLILTAIPESSFVQAFTGDLILDPLIGALIGSIAAGNPMNSYIIGGELLGAGVSLVAVAAFMIAWVTVGVVQFPAESMVFGRRFALTRNLASFFMAIAMAVIIVMVLGVLG